MAILNEPCRTFGRARSQEAGALRSSYLCFREVQLPGQLRALTAHHVLAPLELQLQAVQLLGREGGPSAFGPVQVQALRQDDLPDGAFGVCAGVGKTTKSRRVSAQRGL